MSESQQYKNTQTINNRERMHIDSRINPLQIASPNETNNVSRQQRVLHIYWGVVLTRMTCRRSTAMQHIDWKRNAKHVFLKVCFNVMMAGGYTRTGGNRTFRGGIRLTRMSCRLTFLLPSHLSKHRLKTCSG